MSMCVIGFIIGFLTRGIIARLIRWYRRNYKLFIGFCDEYKTINFKKKRV